MPLIQCPDEKCRKPQAQRIGFTAEFKQACSFCGKRFWKTPRPIVESL